MDVPPRPLVAVDANVLIGLGAESHIVIDALVRGIDYHQLGLVLQAFDLSAPVIATPGEVVKKFFQR